MASKTRLSTYCTKRPKHAANLATSRRVNTRLTRPIGLFIDHDVQLSINSNWSVYKTLYYCLLYHKDYWNIKGK